MSGLAVLDRTLADSADRDSWLHLHDKVIGSSTAGKFAKASSVETYVRQILEPRSFHGNETTASGHRWEPALLAWAGAEPNSLFIHHPENRRFACTVDGTKRVGGDLVIVEAKTKHDRVVTEPTAYEIRQLAWHLFCIPEATHAEWIWGELVRQGPDVAWDLRRDPQTLVYHREHPKIVAATALIVPIAAAVVRLLDEAREEAWT